MSPTVNRRTVLCAAAAVLGVTILPLAVVRADTVALVDVYDRSAGEALTIYPHHGREYIEGRPGNEYAVRIRNCSTERVLAVLSVDGVNAVSGETASFDQAGYVIEPGDYVTVQGWRKDLDRTAAFYFTDPAASYAARTGRPHDLGVIGVALFRERTFERHGQVARREAPAAAPQRAAGDAATDAAESRAKSANAADSSSSAVALEAQAPSLGTGHGRGEYSPVERVEFRRARSRPDQVVTLRYERRETLVAMGVLPASRPRWHEPDPFPHALGFVPDP
jgi:hypothetical protein